MRAPAGRAAAVVVGAALALTACADGPSADPAQAAAEAEAPAASTAPASTTTPAADGTVPAPVDDGRGHQAPPPAELLPAYLATAPYQDVAVAEAAGWASTADTLGCFEDPGRGGMGVHWLNEALLDDRVDLSRPEALVYELGADGQVEGLVAHEYLVPVDAWTGEAPPELLGVPFHQHPVLPFWILHLHLWKHNPAGMLEDWNPAVRPCPDGVDVFGGGEAAEPPARTAPRGRFQ